MTHLAAMLLADKCHVTCIIDNVCHKTLLVGYTWEWRTIVVEMISKRSLNNCHWVTEKMWRNAC